MVSAALDKFLIYSIKKQPRSFNWWRPGLFQLALGVVAFLVSGQVGTTDWWIPGSFLVVSGFLLIPPIYWALKRPIAVVLADHLLVLTIAFFVYFVIGAMLLPFGPRDEAEFSLAYYRINASIAMNVAAVNSIGFGLALGVNIFAPKRAFARIAHSVVIVGDRIPLEWVIAGFLALGSYAYIYVLNFDVNPQSDFVISGSWRSLSNLLLAAVVLASAHRGKGARFLRTVALVMVVVQAIGGLLTLNKGQVLMPIVALCIGYTWRLGVRKVALPGLTLLLSTFLIIASPVATVRNLYGADSKVDWNTRISVLWDGVFKSKTDSLESEYYPWSRFCYTPPQAAAMDLYDAGRGGDDFEKAGWVFLPRFLFPEKPNITAAGQDFHYKITGFLNSATGQGVFVNGYYNLGLLGVFVSGLGVGWMLACTSAFALVVLKRRALIWLPFALLGSYMAFRIDGFFLGDFFGPFTTLLYGLTAATLIAKFLNRFRRDVP